MANEKLRHQMHKHPKGKGGKAWKFSICILNFSVISKKSRLISEVYLEFIGKYLVLMDPKIFCQLGVLVRVCWKIDLRKRKKEEEAMIDSEESHYKSNKSHKNLLKNVGPKKNWDVHVGMSELKDGL